MLHRVRPIRSTFDEHEVTKGNPRMSECPLWRDDLVDMCRIGYIQVTICLMWYALSERRQLDASLKVWNNQILSWPPQHNS